MEEEMFGFFIGVPKERIYQKTKGGVHYDQGTLFYIDDDGTDSAKQVAFTPLDTEFASASNLKYVGIVAAIDGLDAVAGQSITICAIAEIDIAKYNNYKLQLTNSQGSTTMGLPFTDPAPQMIQGLGRLKLTKSLQ